MKMEDIKLKGLNESERNAFIEVVATIQDPTSKQREEVSVYHINLENRTFINTRRERTPKLLNETAYKRVMDLVQETLAKRTQIFLGVKEGTSYYAPLVCIYQAVNKKRIIDDLDKIRVQARIPVILKNTNTRRRLGWKPSHD